MNSKTSDQTLDGGARAGGADGSLGQQLRGAREARGLSLREISEQTRITMRHLEAIESDDYKHLPGGIFNKSFVRAYARQVGFDERAALELYAALAREHGDHPDEVATSPQRSRIYIGETARSPLMTAGLSALMIGVLILVVYAGLHYYRRTESEPAPAPAAAPAAAAPPPAAAQPPAAEGFQIQLRARRSFWLTSWQDDERKRGRFVSPDKPEEFAPAQALNLHFEKVSADALEVSVNGQSLRVPPDTTVWKITKDNYRQFLP